MYKSACRAISSDHSTEATVIDSRAAYSAASDTKHSLSNAHFTLCMGTVSNHADTEHPALRVQSLSTNKAPLEPEHIVPQANSLEALIYNNVAQGGRVEH